MLQLQGATSVATYNTRLYMLRKRESVLADSQGSRTCLNLDDPATSITYGMMGHAH